MGKNSIQIAGRAVDGSGVPTSGKGLQGAFGTGLAMQRGVWILILMILIMPFEKSPYFYISESFAGVISDFTVIKLLGMTGFVWALFQIVNGAGTRVFDSIQARLFALLFLGVLVSAALNDSALFAITKYLVFIMFLPFVLVTLRTERDVSRVLYTIVLGMTFIFPYALRQLGRYNADRLGVGLYEPNYLAANLVLIIPIAFAIASYQPTRGRKLCWIGAGLVLVAELFLTASRGGFLGLLVAGMTFAYRRAGLKGAIGAFLLLMAAVLPTDLGARALGGLTQGAEVPAGVEESNRAHTALFWGGVRMMLDAPLLGVGPQRFKDYSQAYSGLNVNYIAHNTYLELAAETGLPVLALYMLLIGTTLAMLNRVSRLRIPGTRPLSAWAEGLFVGLTGFAVSAAFISAQYEKFFWLILFVAIVISRLALRRIVERGGPERAPQPPQSTSRSSWGSIASAENRLLQ
jgi:O-antigen ligase